MHNSQGQGHHGYSAGQGVLTQGMGPEAATQTSVALCILALDLLIKHYLEVRALFVLHVIFYNKGEGNGTCIMVKGTKPV